MIPCGATAQITQRRFAFFYLPPAALGSVVVKDLVVGEATEHYSPVPIDCSSSISSVGALFLWDFSLCIMYHLLA